MKEPPRPKLEEELCQIIIMVNPEGGSWLSWPELNHRRRSRRARQVFSSYHLSTRTGEAIGYNWLKVTTEWYDHTRGRPLTLFIVERLLLVLFIQIVTMLSSYSTQGPAELGKMLSDGAIAIRIKNYLKQIKWALLVNFCRNFVYFTVAQLELNYLE